MGCLLSRERSSLEEHLISNKDEDLTDSHTENMHIVCDHWSRSHGLQRISKVSIDLIVEYAFTPFFPWKYGFDSYGAYDWLVFLTIIGDENTGKSNILQRFTRDIFSEEYLPTIGVDIGIKSIGIEQRTLRLQCWDTAGQLRFRSITNSYYRGTHGRLALF